MRLLLIEPDADLCEKHMKRQIIDQAASLAKSQEYWKAHPLKTVDTAHSMDAALKLLGKEDAEYTAIICPWDMKGEVIEAVIDEEIFRLDNGVSFLSFAGSLKRRGILGGKVLPIASYFFTIEAARMTSHVIGSIRKDQAYEVLQRIALHAGVEEPTKGRKVPRQEELLSSPNPSTEEPNQSATFWSGYIGSEGQSTTFWSGYIGSEGVTTSNQSSTQTVFTSDTSNGNGND